MPYVTTADGIRAYYDLAGSGPALVMVHGASQDSLSWQYVLDHFAPFYTVYALDLPGHGKSGMPLGGPHTATPQNAHYLLQFLDAAGIQDPVLMGHSMGGGVVAQAAAMAPERIRGLEVVTDARRCIPAVAFADICAFGGFRMEQILDDIRCPVVIVEGGEDWSVPPESAREVERLLREGKVPVEYIEWPGIGHFPQSECPEQFTRDTLAAMRRLSL